MSLRCKLSDEQIRKRKAVLSAIPIYPSDKSIADLDKELGFNTHMILHSLSAEIPICEDQGRYCWPDISARKKGMRRTL